MPKINHAMTAQEWTLLLVLSAIWSSTFFFNSIALREFPPITAVFLRVAIAAAFLVPLMLAMGQRFPADRRAWASFFWMGLLNNVVPFCMVAWGQTHISSALTSILNATTPLWTVLIAHLVTHDEKMTLNKVAGVLIGMAGVAWMVGTDAWHTPGTNVLAQLAVVAATALYAISGIYAKRFNRFGVSPMVTAAGLCTASSIMLLPLMLLFDRPWTIPMPSAVGWGAILAMGLLAMAIPYILFFRIVATAGATNLMLMTFLIPIGAILLGTLVLHEQLEAKHFIGTALIATGLAAIDGRLLKRLRPSGART